VADLIQHPTVQLRLHERSIRDEYQALKKKEIDIDKKMDSLKEREEKLKQREEALRDREIKA
jgi:uncharacterized protein with von Willebrand factor type A (vWA) domain